MRVTRGAVISFDALYCVVRLDGLAIASPPRCTGSAMRSLSMSLKGFCPVRDGSIRCRMVSSSSWKRFSQSGMVLARYAHLLERPWQKAAYAACGWVVAIDERLLTSLIHVEIFFLTYLSMKLRVPIAAPRYRFPSTVMATSVPSNSVFACSRFSSLTTRLVLGAFG